MRMFLYTLLAALTVGFVIFFLALLFSKPRRRKKTPRMIKELMAGKFAHRGLFDESLGIHENTLSSFKRAVDGGFGIELDVHITKDGVCVVMHDDSLLRTCGTDLKISESSYEDIKDIKIGNTDKIPLFSEVLALVDRRVPLIIELKTDSTEVSLLCKRVCECLEGYDGAFCIESFDPRVIMWFKRNRPDIVRGQLAANFKKESKVANPILRFVSRTLFICMGSSPDFIAYDLRSASPVARLYFRLWKPYRFVWTVRDNETLEKYSEEGIASIFEGFIPKG